MVKAKISEIVILGERCKECAICLEFCPRQVLAANDDNKPVVKNIENCSGCRLCEYRCPDLAITVKRKEEATHG